MGGATAGDLSILSGHTDFNPRSPWGERLGSRWICRVAMVFQSTLPVGGATTSGASAANLSSFQSTLPVGGATCGLIPFILHHGISIHAPRGGSDVSLRISARTANDFNPRSPWGERHQSPYLASTLNDFNPRSPWGERRVGSDGGTVMTLFQSTLPVGGATYNGSRYEPKTPISIHAPRGGSDCNRKERTP